MTDRERDERDLCMIRARHEGKLCKVIGEAFGVTDDRVRTITNRIRSADETQCGEDLSEAYW